VRDNDLIYRPPSVQGGAVRFKVNDHSVLARSRRGGVFSVKVPAGARVSATRGRDRFGNVSSKSVTLSNG
jgi:hypothetical protein